MFETPYYKGQINSRVGQVQLDGSFTWEAIEWLLSLTRLPVLLKGIMESGRCRPGSRTGAAGIIVSNHGGRVFDTLRFNALEPVIEKVGAACRCLVDGGIRRGTDVLKAIALGANAVLIGRPYVYGLAVNGAEGVAKVVDILRNELQMAMALTGRRDIQSIDRSVLWT
jgi:4-hydroxymandelate oxidase